MSFANPSLVKLTSPVPEELLDDKKTAKERHTFVTGYRSFQRLKEQEKELAKKADVVRGPKPPPEAMSWKPERRLPIGRHSKTLKAQIPAILQTMGGPQPPASPARTGGRPATIDSSPATASSTRSALPPRPATSDSPSQGFLSSRPPGTPAWARSAVDPADVKPKSPSEKIGCLLSPSASVRSLARNVKMAVPDKGKPRSPFRSFPTAPPPPVSDGQRIVGVDPALSSFHPLDDFDNTDLDPCTPEEWVAMGQDCGGTPARSKFHYDSEHADWAPCRVQDYNPTTGEFLIEWNDTRKQKWVRRLNLVFDDEDPELWQIRLDHAMHLRAEAESKVRLWLYIEQQPDEWVAPIDEVQVDRILALVAVEFPRVHLPCIEQSISELRAMYSHAVKQAVFTYKYRAAEEQRRLAGLNLPPPEPRPPPPMKGTIDIPYRTFANARRYIEENLFFTHYILYGTLYSIITRWEPFSNQLLVDTTLAELDLPCELLDFKRHQEATMDKVSDKLKNDWSVNISSTIQNDLDSHFNFYEDDIDRFNASRMSRFMRTINLIMSHQLRSLIVTSLGNYTTFIKRFDVADDGMWDPAQAAKSLSGNVPLFVINLCTGDRGIVYEPSLEQVREVVEEVFSNIFAFTEDIPGVGEKLFPLLSLGNAALRSVAPTEDVIVEGKAVLQRVLDRNMIGPHALKDLYAEFEYLVTLNIDRFIQEFSQNSPTLEDYQRQMNRVYGDIEKIKVRSLNEVAFELLKVECYEVKASLIRKANEVANAVMRLLGSTAKQDTQAVNEAYEDIYQRIQFEPANPEEMQELKKYIDGCQERVNELNVKFNEISDTVALMSQFGFMLNEDDFQFYWSTYSWPQRVVTLVQDSDFKYKENRNRFQQELKENTTQLSDDISHLQREVDKFSSFSDEGHVDQYYGMVQQLNNSIKTYKELIELYNSREVIFGLPTTQYSHINEITKNFEPYQQLWTIVYENSRSYPQWHEGIFTTLEPEIIEVNVANWTKTLHRLGRQLKDEPPGVVAVSVREKLELFKPHIPLIAALRNPGLRDRHWKRISALTGQSIKLEESTTFNNFLAAGLQLHLAAIQEISEYASKEYRLEKQLEKMQGEWRSVQFELAPYGNTHMLKSVDDIQQLLDDHIVKTQTMLGSPYVKAIELQVKQWEGKLLRMQSILDEWLKCQGVWHYLEPIFSSSDIQKSMPGEAQKFSMVNSVWHTTMEATVKNPYVLQRSAEDRILPLFVDANKMLDAILKQLQQFLETKRMAFPRFYFLSNEELLEILAETKDPLLVQPHLKKCFEGIHRLRFEPNLDITAMFSSEGEEVRFVKACNPQAHNNSVELWLTETEKIMRDTVRHQVMESIDSYLEMKREDWMLQWPGQVVICVSCMFWTRDVEEALNRAGLEGLQGYEGQCNANMTKLIELVRGDLKKVQRCTLEALVVIEVHNRDVVTQMIADGCGDVGNFQWLAQLRYYWENNTVKVRQVNAEADYAFEYLGNTGRLVITPLTDRCYRTLMGAVHLNLGGAPEGPAGTGKTETTKDLAKALAKQCVVYNCSDQISYREMAKLFKGLSSSGAWGCFDEFNRIDIQVLSVIAQQVATIQIAIGENRTEFLFEGVIMKLKKGCSVFITMNPGYAGRAELPDNLKALFRPVAMMVPDYALIAEISLFSYGFLIGRALARKIVATYKLCSEQLSSQDHYDYGMRAVKSVLTAAGSLKRRYPDEDEMVIMLRGIIDVNLPKFLAQDLELFQGIVSDLFPGVVLPTPDYKDLHEALAEAFQFYNLQNQEIFMTKTLQVYEMVNVRHGLMVVGYSYAGKSSALSSLARGLTTLAIHGLERKTQLYCMNPKSITMGQLYGQNDVSMEWNDGVLSKVFRSCAHETNDDRKWLVLDGPVDAIWIENMNTVLDDNKKLCLVNGDMISMSNSMNMVFEVQDLAVASPATVSRCGMIYMEPEALGWRPLFRSWLNTLPDPLKASPLAGSLLTTLFEQFVDPALEFSKQKCKRTMSPVNDVTVIAGMLRLLGTFMPDVAKPRGGDSTEEDGQRDLQMWLEAYFLFCAMWSVGAIVDYQSRLQFDRWLRTEIGQPPEEKEKAKAPARKGDDGKHKFLAQWPEKRTLYDYVWDREENRFMDWLDTIPEFKIAPESQYHEVIVPTTDTIRYSFLLRQCVNNGLPLMFIGTTGTGKSILVKDMFLNHIDKERYVPMFLQFSAQTSANQTQDIIDNRLEKRRKGVFGPPIGKRALIFVDDTSMPEPEQYGAQPPIEILRQWLDYHGWYERKKDNVDFKEIQDIMFYCAMAPPGGGRNNVTPRFARHFNLVTITTFDETTMKKIFGTLLDFVVTRPNWGAFARGMVPHLVHGTLTLFDHVCSQMLPTPEKSHYTFNLRDVSKVFQGMSMGAPEKIASDSHVLRLWIHECQRTFMDRLINDEDRLWFTNQLNTILQATFKRDLKTVVDTDPLIYADYMEQVQDDRVYEEITDLDVARRALEEYLDAYNAEHQKKMDLVVFNYVIEHVSRLARVLKQPSGNALLIGVGGSGRQSCTRLAAHIADNKLFTITLSKSYGRDAWRDDMRVMLRQAGAAGQPTVFLFMDSQIMDESFLEDISNILNTGEIPNLYPAEDVEGLTEAVKGIARETGRNLNRDALFNFFVERCRLYLHIVLGMSPIGAALRTRLRKFPALVNCCTIDWFSTWPTQALKSVAKHFLDSVPLDDKLRVAVVDLCEFMHRSVRDLCPRFTAATRLQTYVTPTLYLELITTFKSLIGSKTEEISGLKRRYDVGLEQLRKTEDEVEEMSKTLELLKPNLLKTAKETEDLIATIERESAEAEKTRRVVSVEEAACNKKADGCKLIRDECEEALKEALPALEMAAKAVSQINKKELGEIRAMTAPSEKIKRVLEAVCVCLDEAPKRVLDPNGKVSYDYWETAKKKVMADTNLFLDRLLNYDKENMTEAIVEKIQPYIKDKNFRPDVVKQVSAALVGLCQWVIAIEKFYRVNKVVKPKKEMLAVADAEFTAAMTDLNKKKSELKAVDDRLAMLQDTLDESNRKKKSLEDEFNNTEKKLARATKLMSGLGGEKSRYTAASEALAQVYSRLLGDVLLSAGAIAYLGPFTSQYRAELLDSWAERCHTHKIPGSEKYSMTTFLGDPVRIQEWQLLGLPSDLFSVENALVSTMSRRWPLFIDPQGQANNWIKNLERPNKLMTLRPTEGDYIKSLAQCVRYGIPVLLENVGEDIDPVLDPLLTKSIFKESGMLSINIGDSTVEYNEKFRFYVTTKLPRPHYKPEISVKVTLLNFAITPTGLQDQLLQKVVQFEEREIEERKNKFVQQGAVNKARLKQCEDDILNLLSGGTNLLEDEEVIDTLDNSKRIADEIAVKQAEIESSQKICDKTRTKFIPVAYRGAQLFFCITELANVDPMYQYALHWYMDLFQRALRDSEPDAENRDQRILNINDFFTYSLYKNVCRSLFEKHKLLLSFILATKIMEVDPAEMRFLLTAGVDVESGKGVCPFPWLPKVTWEYVCRTAQLPAMAHFVDHLVHNGPAWQQVYDSRTPHEEGLPEPWDRASSMHQLIVLRLLRPDKLVPAITRFVVEHQDARFIEPPLFDLPAIFEDSVDPWVPLIFILSSGADPYAEVQKFAEERGMTKRLESLSLGQGMGRRAAEQITVGRQQGLWVLLQNCHLYADWMPRLEKIVEDYSSDDNRNSVNKAYRLWLTSMPSTTFPVAILQAGIKMIIEPPRGLRANLLRSFTGDPLNSSDFFGGVAKAYEWKKLVFGLCFFHAVVQERRSFGPLGWNIPYEFNETDLRISMRQLREYCTKPDDLPFDALTYLTGHCNYGGRVTDDHDRRCLMAILADYYCEAILGEGYRFSVSGEYVSPDDGPYEAYVEYIKTLPLTQTPDLFGLHANADITKDERETKMLLDGVLLTQPRGAGGGGDGADAGAAVSEVARGILAHLAPDFDLAACLKKYPVRYNESMNTVLLQEMVRFNRLLVVVRSSLQDVIKAIKGEIVMSPQLEGCFNNMYDGRIPALWMSKSYPSLKPLGGYVADLMKRIEFFQRWYDEGPPSVFWLSGFYFTQSFLTGVLQNFARKYKVEIDTLKWEFTVMHDPTYNQPPEDGCYVDGLFLEGAGWDHEQKVLCESEPKVLFVPFPVMWMQPVKESEVKKATVYVSPLYKTSDRRGILSTTGHSTNFVMPVRLPTDQDPNHWVKRGCALLCQLDY